MGISEILFITEIIINTAGEDINNTVDYFQLINDIKIKLWEKLISVSLIAVEFTDNNEVFQIFIISEYSYKINNAINFRTLLFKCFNNDK